MEIIFLLMESIPGFQATTWKNLLPKIIFHVKTGSEY